MRFSLCVSDRFPTYLCLFFWGELEPPKFLLLMTCAWCRNALQPVYPMIERAQPLPYKSSDHDAIQALDADLYAHQQTDDFYIQIRSMAKSSTRVRLQVRQRR